MPKDTLLHRRLNITLPEDTVDLLDRVSGKGGRSRFIAEAVEYYVRESGRKNLKRRIEEGARVRAGRDAAIARDWFDIEG